MDKAETNLGHGQRLDKLWTKFGQTLDKDWTLRPEFVRPPILQEHRFRPSLNFLLNLLFALARSVRLAENGFGNVFY